jgi:hypothetical protein
MNSHQSNVLCFAMQNIGQLGLRQNPSACPPASKRIVSSVTKERSTSMSAVGTQPAGMPPASNPFHRRMHLGVTDGAPRAESLEALAPLTPAMSQKPTFPRALNPDLQTFLNKRVGRAQPPA